MKLFCIYLLIPLYSLSLILLPIQKHNSLLSKELRRKLSTTKRFVENNQDGTSASSKGFGPRSSIPRPKIITPSRGKINANLDKFLMMYTCKLCSGRNAQMVSKVAYSEGTVISRCKHCEVKHLIADNRGLLDLPAYGKQISDFLTSKGETVQRLSVSERELEDNYLVDDDGTIRLVPKIGGQLSPDATVVEYPSTNTDS